MLRLVLGMLLLSCNFAHAQIRSSGIVVVFTMPNPDDRLSIISLAKNASVQQAVGMTTEQSKLLREAIQANGGGFGNVGWHHDGPPQKVDYDAMRKYAQAERARHAEFLDELITPAQWTRLRQIAYQVQIARLGWQEAVTDGKFSVNVGIHENQKNHLREKAVLLEAAAFDAIYKVRARTQVEFLAALPRDLAAKVQTLIGSPFPFREDSADERKLNRELTSKKQFGTQFAKMPDPQQKLPLSSLLLNASVRQEVQFSDSQIKKLIDIVLANPGNVPDTRLGEIVSAEQWEHLPQSFYQRELTRLGLEEAIVQGRLGQDLMVDEGTRKLLADNAAEVEARAEETIVSILKHTQEQILEELSSEQRAKARNLLGEPFYLANDEYWRYAR